MSLPVISVSQMREWEKATWATGQTEAEVIRSVGKCVATHALRLTHPNDSILILAGKGHNGEDARCAREHLSERRVDLLDVKAPAGDLSRLDSLLSLRPALIIDGLFGIGLNRPLSADWTTFINRINAAETKVLAVDVPSGLNAETGDPEGTSVRATVTLTVGAPKLGMLKPGAVNFVGRLELANDVGLIPCPCASDLQWTMPDDFAGFPPPRPVASHKGTWGHLAIIAGSSGYHGASVLAARGAQRAQPGLITLYSHESIYHPVASQLQAVMVAPWKTELQVLESATSILIGPGLANHEQTKPLLDLTRRLWLESPLPLIVDASALAWLPPGPVPETALRLITPHPGEAARLLNSSAADVQNNRIDSLRRLSEKFGHTWVILKGHQTLVGRSTGPIYVNSTGNPYLAQGGSGDTLSGYVAALLAPPELQSESAALQAIRFAVWDHGAAADRLTATRPNWVIEELAPELNLRTR